VANGIEAFFLPRLQAQTQNLLIVARICFLSESVLVAFAQIFYVAQFGMVVADCAGAL
jgi:hypothetical protein